MIDQKKEVVSNEILNNKMDTSAMTTSSSSFIHLSMDDIDVSTVGEDQTTSPSQTATGSPSFVLYNALVDICLNNVKYYECDESETGQRFLGAFSGIIDHVAIAKQFVEKISAFAHEYDFDEHTPANGYRSFVKTIQACINHCLKVSKIIAQNRSYLLFRKNMYMKEIEACCHLLASLCSCLEQLMIIRQNSEHGSLFPAGEHKAIGLFNTSASVNQYCFYGRCIGFHYCESMQSVMKFLGICLAGFSEAYYRDGNRITKATSSMWTGGKYYWNPEMRARRIVNLSQYAGIDFCKAFWSLTEGELMYALPNVFGVKIKVNRLITIPPEPLEMESTVPNEVVQIPVPSSHLGVGPVVARLLSNCRREGMIGERNKKHIHSPAKSLIFHCHGGGFVAQSSKSHEIYLREWAAKLNVPILSIDYSLAPQAPYPRALEEVFYAYCWAIKNAKLLGTTAEKIVVVGDSAGANLNMALTLKCIDQKIRKPDGVFLIYSPVKMGFDPSPARFLCLMDVLLPFGFLMGCLKAYVHPGKDQHMVPIEKKRKNSKATENDDKSNVERDLSMSTTSAVIVLMSEESESEMPTFVHIGSEHQDNDQANERHTDNSISMDGSSAWERIEHDVNGDVNNKSIESDGTSDTFASASLHNSQTGGNTEMMTPDESNGISFEEDSQPITLHKPQHESNTFENLNNIGSVNRRNSTSSSLVEMDSSDHKADAKKSDLPETYVIDMVTDENGVKRPILKSVPRTKSEENVLLDESRDALNMQSIPNKIYKAVETAASSVANTFNAITSPTQITNGIPMNDLSFNRSRLNSLTERNPADDYLFDVPRDPFLSPYYASDEALKQLPAMKILSVDMDPCLDDCIMLAKKLKALGVPVGVDVLPGLPHGFLSFVKLSKEAYEGNRVCISRLAELLDIKLEQK